MGNGREKETLNLVGNYLPLTIFFKIYFLIFICCNKYKMSEGSIPNLISLSQIPVNFLQSVETDLLEPVVFNQGSATADGFTRFTLQNKGFLHSHSKVFLSVQSGAGVTNGYFTPTIGIGQVIKKAVLKIGNKTLNEVSAWDGLFAAKSTLIKSENNLERELYTTGRCMNEQFIYNASSDTQASSYGLDNGLEYGTATTEVGLAMPTWAKMDTTKPAESPTFSVDLSDLFPFLKVNQLPLYMITEPINIELTFYPTVNHRLQIASTDTASAPALIRRQDIKFCADYVFYGESDEMERFADANKDMSFSFVDYRLIEATVTPATLASGIIRNLGMANRIVPRIITAVTDDVSADELAIISRANSLSPDLTAGVPGVVKYNIRYNDRYEFSRDVVNTARLFSILTDSEGVPFISRAGYSHQKDEITDQTLEGRVQSDSLQGSFFYLGTRLTGGRVGQRGLELHLSGDFPNDVTVLRSYAEYLRVARLSGGMMDIFNA